VPNDLPGLIEGAIAPFSRQFPGLAAGLDEGLTPEQMGKALGSRASRIGLAPAARPADVLPLIGWDGAVNRYHTALPIAAVLRSWEDRFGARLLDIGFAQIRLLAQRPPRTLQAAQSIAAERGSLPRCGRPDRRGGDRHLERRPGPYRRALPRRRLLAAAGDPRPRRLATGSDRLERSGDDGLAAVRKQAVGVVIQAARYSPSPR
jgi:hypothetical protein